MFPHAYWQGIISIHQIGGSAIFLFALFFINFNTSNVEVPPNNGLGYRIYLAYFNTSNVEVPPKAIYKLDLILGISIHQMWRFRFPGRIRKALSVRFQYIKCGGSAEAVEHEGEILSLFQYIKCGGSAIFAFRNPSAMKYFNTSCGGSAKRIDLQLRAPLLFQYIKCGGSAL